MKSEAFRSGCRLILDTKSMGPVDVSDDVISLSPSLRTGAVSTLSISLNNYSNQLGGRYNMLLSIGDKVHMDFYVNGIIFPIFTGRIFSVPLVAFDAQAFTIEAQDCIGDLNFQYWSPYSVEAQTKYLTFNQQSITEAAVELGEEDSGLGNLFLDFLENVCHFPKNSIYIQAFPDLNNVMKNILKTIVCNKNPNYEDEIENIFGQYFGTITNAGTIAGSSNSSANNPENNITADVVMGYIQSLTGSKKNWPSGEWYNQTKIECKYVNEGSGEPTTIMMAPGNDNGSRSGMYGLRLCDVKKYLANNEKINYAAYLPLSQQQQVFSSLWADLIKQYQDPCLAFLNYWLPGTNQNFKGKSKGGIQAGGKNGASCLLIINGGVVNQKSDIENPLLQEAKKYDKLPAKDNTKWAQWLKTIPIGTGKYAISDNPTPNLGEQCWSLYESYTHFLFGWNYQGGPNYQPDGANSTGIVGNGAYYLLGKDNPTITNVFDILPANATAKTGDVVFWSKSGGLNDSLGQTYGHVAIVVQDQGGSLLVENQWLGSGGVVQSSWPKNASGWAIAGYFRPKMFASDTLSLETGSSSSSSTLSASTKGAAAYNDMFELFKFVQFNNAALTQESENLDKYDNLYDNEPVFGFVQSLCNASMRTFTSLPDGSFTAFVPDHFGYFSEANPDYDNLVELDPINLIDYSISMNKSSYISHVFCLTNEAFPNLWGQSANTGLSTACQLMESSGIVSLQRNPEELAHLISLDGTGFATSAKGIGELLQEWGVQVLKAPDPNIESHVMTGILAVYKFVESWAHMFTANIQVSFRPDLRPGLRIHLSNLGITCYIESVTHSWNAQSGGTTSLQVNSIVNDKGRAGM